MRFLSRVALIILLGAVSFKSASCRATGFIGNWSLHLPDGRPVWLQINEDSTVFMLWSVGSKKQVEVKSFSQNGIIFTGDFSYRPNGNQKWCKITEPFSLELLNRNKLKLTVTHDLNGVEEKLVLEGKKMPPMPARPDLEKLHFGTPVNLLAKGLKDWSLENKYKKNGWSFDAGILINETPKTDFSAYGEYANLLSKRNFYDFELTIDYNIGAGGNSGIYLRGAYEVQIVDKDSRMQGIQGPAAVFGRIKPEMNNAKPAGEWNHLRVILLKRHITVELNGKTVIDNQPLEGCTGGGINSDDTKPGPIFMQGDHTSVQYRNITIREIK